MAAYLAIGVPQYVKTIYELLEDCLPQVQIVYAPAGNIDWSDMDKVVWAPADLQRPPAGIVELDENHRYILAKGQPDIEFGYFRRGFANPEPATIPFSVTSDEFKVNIA